MKKTVNEKSYITIDLWKALSILGVSVLTTCVGTAFAVGRTINTDHFKLASVSGKVSALEEQCVKKDVYTIQLETLTSSINEIKTDVKKLLGQ